MNRVAAALGLTAIFVSALNAQILGGRVSRAAQPVNGAVMTLVDANGRAVGRTVARDGAFSLASPAAGTFRVQVLQIGWRPTNAGPYELRAGGTTTANIDLTSARIALDAIVVTDKSVCGARADSSEAAFVVWQEARKAFTATALTRAEPLTMTLTRGEQMLDKSGARVIADSSGTQTAPSLNPFVSWPADSLAARGYVTRDASGARTYWAPDADVLLSESFFTTHCFRTRRPAAGTADADRLIGAVFDPAGTRKDVVDIAGVVWVDRFSGELRAVDYQYTNAPAAVDQARAGGRIEFLHAPGGRWIADRWSIRYPVIASGVRRSEGPVVPGQTRSAQNVDELSAIKITSGQVSQIKRGGSVLWERGRVSAAVRVVDSVSGAPLRGVLVGLAGGSSSTATDSNGIVRIDRLDPGSATLHLEAGWLSALGFSPWRVKVDVPAVNDAVIAVRAPSGRLVVAARCGGRVLDWGEGMVRVASRVSLGRVVVRWRTRYAQLGGADSVVVEEEKEAAVENGEYVVCGVPRDAVIEVRRVSETSLLAPVATFAREQVAVLVTIP